MREDFQIPNFGEGPVSYEKGYLNRLVRNIEMTFRALKAKGPINATTVNATTVAADSMTVDDLAVPGTVVGTWTPTLAFGGASTGITYGTQQGTYVKTGRVVTFQFRLIITSKGSATGNVAILGLPYASDNYHPVTFGYGTNFTGLTGMITGYMENNSANITLRQSAANGTGPILTDAVFTATTDMIIGGSYISIS